MLEQPHLEDHGDGDHRDNESHGFVEDEALVCCRREHEASLIGPHAAFLH